MKKRKRRIPKALKQTGNLARPAGKAIILILGGFVGVVLTFTTVSIALAFAWLTTSGELDGSIEVGQRTITMNPTLETALAWVAVGALVVANISFYYLVFRFHKGR